MTKGSAEAKPPERPVPPRTIEIAIAAVCVQVVFGLLYAVLEWPLGDQLRRSILNANGKKAKPSLLCGSHAVKGCLDVGKTVRTVQLETAIGTVLVALLIAFLARRVRRGIRSGRTGYVAVSVIGAVVGFASSPLSLLAVVSSGPVLPRAVSTLGAGSCVAAIVLMFMRESTKFLPKVARQGAPPRGLGGLFAPRPSAGRKPAPASGLRSSAASRAATRAMPKGGAAGQRAKVRSEQAAVARGAELARMRAKASKSRRTEL